MKTAVARISSKYQLVIPKAVRESLDLRPDSGVLFIIDGDTVILRPQPENFTEALRGLHKELWEIPIGGLPRSVKHGSSVATSGA